MYPVLALFLLRPYKSQVLIAQARIRSGGQGHPDGAPLPHSATQFGAISRIFSSYRIQRSKVSGDRTPFSRKAAMGAGVSSSHVLR